MEPKTKAEALRNADVMRTQANAANQRIVECICAGDRSGANRHRDEERRLLNEAARLRAILPTLPDRHAAPRGKTMKIHEQEWKTQSNGVVAVSDAVVIRIEVAPWRLPRVPDMDDWEMAAKVSHEATMLIASAPEMARALLEQVRDSHHDGCTCQMCAALRSAGVL